jgi:hypothetical protein
MGGVTGTAWSDPAIHPGMALASEDSPAEAEHDDRLLRGDAPSDPLHGGDDGVDKRRHFTDQVFHAKMALHHPVYIADGCWDRYRQHDGSACHTVQRAGQLEAAFLGYLSWLEAYLSEQGAIGADPDLQAALRSALRQYRHPWLHRIERRAVEQVGRVRRALAGPT